MIMLSNGHSFEYMTASGAMGYDGLGWPWEWPLRWLGAIDPSLFTHVTKTLTWDPIVGNLRWWNPLRCIRVWADGTLNAVGLTNPGWRWWENRIGPRVDRVAVPLIVSITADRLWHLRHIATYLSVHDIVGIKFNPSCPNTAERRDFATIKRVVDGCRAIREAAPEVPLLIKLSIEQPWRQIVPELEGLVETIAINSVHWRVVCPGRRSPLAHFGGGAISGRRAQPYNWPMIQELVQLTDIPVIGCGVWTYSDLAKLWGMGVKAISFGAVHIPFPTRPTWMVRREQIERRMNRVRTLQCEIAGAVAQRILL